jgi:hypothetical protein
MNAANKQNQAPKINSAVAFKFGSNISEKWQCSASHKQTILSLSKSSYYRFHHNEGASLLTTN